MIFHNHTTAVYKMKVASFQNINITNMYPSAVPFTIILFSHGSFKIRHLLTLLHTPLSELDGNVDNTSSDLG